MKNYPNLKKQLDKFVNGGLENLIVVLLGTYISMYIFGNYRNTKISKEWLDQVRETIFSNFAVISTKNKEMTSAEQIEFEDVSSNRYPLYCSGRENINYAYI